MALTATHCNGIDIDLLGGMVAAIREQPAAGFVTVRTRHRWDDGFAVDSHCETLEQAGQVTTRTHAFRTDWPEPWGGDSGPTPGAESLMAALGACVATTYIAKAALRGVAIAELDVTVEGRVDLQGLFDLDEVRSGFSGITVTVGVHADADDAVLEELGRDASRMSPVYDSLANPVAMHLSVQRLQ